MNNFTEGNVALVYRYLGFLVEEYGMKFKFDIISSTIAIENPTYVYSFYNNHGCFSIREIAQRSEWDCYAGSEYTVDICNVRYNHIDQRSYIKCPVFFVRTFLKLTAKEIRRQIKKSQAFLGISV